MKKTLYGFLMCVISLSVITPVQFAFARTRTLSDNNPNEELTATAKFNNFISLNKYCTETKDPKTVACLDSIKEEIEMEEVDTDSRTIKYFKEDDCYFGPRDERICAEKSDDKESKKVKSYPLCDFDLDNMDTDANGLPCGDRVMYQGEPIDKEEAIKIATEQKEQIKKQNDVTTQSDLSEAAGVVTGKVAGKLTGEDDDDDDDIKGKEIGYNILSGASTAAMGLGAMEAAQALSEKKQDAAAERDMAAYLATMRCETAKGKSYKLSNEDIELDGGSELINYVSEYKELAARQKNIKNALNMAAGIESEEILDKADGGLYEYTPAVKGKSKNVSLANALRDENSEDAKDWAEQKEKTKKHLKIGAAVAAAGLVTAVATNLTLGKDIRDARAEQDNDGIGDAKTFGFNEND